MLQSPDYEVAVDIWSNIAMELAFPYMCRFLLANNK